MKTLKQIAWLIAPILAAAALAGCDISMDAKEDSSDDKLAELATGDNLAPAESYMLQIYPPESSGYPVMILEDFRPENWAADSTLVLAPALQLCGQVLSPDGVAVSANVTARYAGTLLQVASDVTENGYYCLRLAAGYYDLEIKPVDGAYPAQQVANLKLFNDVDAANVQLEIGELYTGRVLDAGGAAGVAGLTVVAISDETGLSGTLGLTDADGNFEIHVKPGPYQLSIAPSEGGPTLPSMSLACQSGLTDFSVAYSKAWSVGRVSGRLVDGAGAPIAGAGVTARYLNTGFEADLSYAGAQTAPCQFKSIDFSDRALTDNAGLFTLDLIDGAYTVFLEAPVQGASSSVFLYDDIDPLQADGSNVDLGDILLPAKVAVGGVVLDEQGVAVPNVTINFKGKFSMGQSFVWQTLTGDDGRFSVLLDTEPAEYEAQLSPKPETGLAMANLSAFTLNPSTDPGDLQFSLAAGVSIAGTVLAPDGKTPVGLVSLKAIDSTVPLLLWAETLADQSGVFVMVFPNREN